MSDTKETMNKYEAAAWVASQMVGECDAIKSYEMFLSKAERTEYPEAILSVVREIISDEKNHLEKLKELLLKFDGIQAATDEQCVGDVAHDAEGDGE